MNEDAPITWLKDAINEIVTTGAGAAAGAISGVITPLVSVCFGIYILLITINYLRGAETEPVMDFGIRCANFAIVIGLGLNAGHYASFVMPIVTGLGTDLANAISGGTVTSGTLDALAKHYLDIIADGFRAAMPIDGLGDLGKFCIVCFKAIIIIVGMVPFLVAATLAIIVADVGSLLIAMVGPLFFACLLFPATRQYFSAWVNTAFSYALIPAFVAVIATISVTLSNQMLTPGGMTLDQTSFTRVFLAAIGNLILLFLLKQVSSIASSLSAGGIHANLASGGVSSATSKALKKAGAGSANLAGKGAALLRSIANRSNTIKPG